MAKFKNKYRIESNRWKYWDYSAPGRYFLTVCIQNRECILGNVVHGEMKLSSSGDIAKSEIEKTPTYHKRIILDEWIIMPNHFHLIIELGDYHFDNGMYIAPAHVVEKIHEFSLPPPTSTPPTSTPPTSTPPTSTPPTSTPPTPTPQSPHYDQQWWHILDYQPTIDEIKQYRKFRRKMIIPKIMGKMKMLTSKQINILHHSTGKKNWQKDYYDHVIRNNTSYQNIKNYIINNPAKWETDTFHPKSSRPVQ